MKRILPAFVLSVLLVCQMVYAGDESRAAAPKVSAELEHIKTLAGKWRGTVTHADGKSDPAEVEYHVTSGGSAVVETLFPGTPHEMVSVYHDNQGKLAMTHYCMIGNQPEMSLQKQENGKMQFGSTPDSRSALAGQTRMDSLMLDESAAGTLVQTWTAISAEGKPLDSTVISFKRA